MADIKSVNKGLTSMLKNLELLEKQFVETGNVMTQGLTTIDSQAKKSLASQQQLTGANKKHREEISKEQKAAQELIKAKNGLVAASTKQAQLTLQLKKQRQDLIKAQKLQIQAGRGEIKTYEQLSARYRIAAQKARDLGAAYGVNSKQARAAISGAKKYNDQLKKVDASLGNHQRNVGNYTAGIKNLVGGYLTFQAVISVIKNVGKTVTDFSKAQSNLAAVLGKSKNDIQDLTNDAKNYGKATAFTATQVSDLQTELGKLGFTQNEIKASTGAVLNFAQATGAELGEAAKVSGAALRAFGLDVTETERVTSVLAVATSKSALSFSDYQTALSTVAPVAKTFGFSIEDSVAMLGKLKDAGFDASTAATSTRNILLNLADSNGALARKLGGSVKSFDQLIPALVKLRSEGVDLNETLKLTDKRSVAAFNQFLEGAESAQVLRDSLVDVKDEMQEMVDTQMDNLATDLKLLGSAWDGLILSIEDGQGVFSKGIRSIVQVTTEMLSALSILGTSLKSANELTEAEALSMLTTYSQLSIGISEEISKAYEKVQESTRENVSRMAATLQLALEDQGFSHEKARKIAVAAAKERVNVLIAERKAIKDAELKAEEDRINAQKQAIEDKKKADAKAIKDRQKRNESLFKADLELFKLEQELNLLRLKNSGASDFEYNFAKLSSKEELYREELRLAEKYAIKIGDTEKNILLEKAEEARQEAIDIKIPDGPDAETSSILDSIEDELADEEEALKDSLARQEDLRLAAGEKEIEDFKRKEEQKKEAISEASNLLLDTLTLFAEQRVELANREVEASKMQVDSAERNLDRQIALAEQGYANDVQGAQKALDLQKATQRAALAEKKRALEQKQKLETIEQGISIITSVASIIQGFSAIPIVGWVLGIAAGAAMLAAFASQKQKAKTATQSFGEGGTIDLEGGSHASGDDIHFGNKDGKELRAEGGEKAAIFSKKATRKYGGALDRFVKDANRMKLEDRYSSAFDLGAMPIFVENNSNFDSIDLKETNSLLRTLINQGENSDNVINNKRVIKRGNITYTING